MLNSDLKISLKVDEKVVSVFSSQLKKVFKDTSLNVFDFKEVISNGFEPSHVLTIVSDLRNVNSRLVFNENFIALLTALTTVEPSVTVLGLKIAYSNFADELLKAGVLDLSVAFALVGGEFPVSEQVLEFVDNSLTDFIV